MRVFPTYSVHRALASAASASQPPAVVPLRRLDPPHAARVYGVAVVATVHVLLFALLWHTEPVRRALATRTPVIVHLLQPAPPPPPPPPPRSRPLPPPRTEWVAPPPIEMPPVAIVPSAPITQSPAPPPPVSSPPAVELAAAPATESPPVAEVTPPRFDADYLRNPAPAYPSASRRDGEEGRTLLRVLVGADGDAQRVEVKTSSGFERLDAAALETVKRWKFVPARQGGTPVAAWVIVPIAFSLRR